MTRRRSLAWPVSTYRRLRRGHAPAQVWALIDQGAVSLGGFLTTLALARNLSPAEYGTYALIFGAALLLTSLYGALVVYPLSVRGAVADLPDLRRYTAQALVVGALALVPMTVTLSAAAALAGRSDLGPPAALAFTLWQIQETLRRALLVHLRHRTAAVGDAVSYVGQALLVWAMAGGGRLSSAAAFVAIGFTSGLGALLQASQLDWPRPRAADLRPALATAWRLGRWTLLGVLVGSASVQSLPWALVLTHGAAEVAAYQAAANLVGVANPVTYSLANLLLPVIAAAHQRTGGAGALRVALRSILYGATLVMPYCAALALWPELALGLVYGAGSPYTAVATQLRILAVAGILNYVTGMLWTVLQGLQRSRLAFVVTLSGATTALAFGVPLAMQLRALGASLALATIQLTRLATSALLVAHAARSDGARDQSASGRP